MKTKLKSLTIEFLCVIVWDKGFTSQRKKYVNRGTKMAYYNKEWEWDIEWNNAFRENGGLSKWRVMNDHEALTENHFC
jgi:hypothetical protein